MNGDCELSWSDLIRCLNGDVCERIEDRGVPDMIPVDEWNDRPIGRDPEIMENDRSSPSQVGVVLKWMLFWMMKMVWL